MTDIDAMMKDAPRIKRIADRMERMLADPFVAGNEAERADALEDLAALREFRDELPQVRERLDALDGLIRDVADLKNRPQFDMSMIPQPNDNNQPGLTEDRVRDIVQEALGSVAQPPSSPAPTPDTGGLVLTEDRVKEIVANELNPLATAMDGASDKIEEFLASHQDTGSGDDSGLSDRVGVVETKLSALMDALDVQQSDLGPQDADAGDKIGGQQSDGGKLDPVEVKPAS